MALMAGEIRRDLRLTSPLTEGLDVKRLQQALNKIARRFPRIADFKLTEDEKLGPKTLLAAVTAARITGLTQSHLSEIEKNHLIAQTVQKTLRHPNTRSDAQKRRAAERRKALRKKLDQPASLKDVGVTLSPGKPHWGGSNDVITQFVEPFLVKRGLPLGSGKRTPTANAAVGGSKTSDHLTTKTRTGARDFPTFAGEDDARALAKSMGFGSWQPNSFTKFTFSAGGHSWHVQILWGAQIKHGDHVHVGVEPA
jgi:hypothetical protein